MTLTLIAITAGLISLGAMAWIIWVLVETAKALTEGDEP